MESRYSDTNFSVKKREDNIDDVLDVSNITDLSEPQRKFLNSKSLWRVLHGGKRGGKTSNIVLDCVKKAKLGMRQPIRKRIIFASATIEKTKSLYWHNLIMAKKKFGLGWEFRNADNKIIIDHFNEIHFRGLRDKPSANMDIGFHVMTLYFDEVHTVRDEVAKHYLDNVIEPNLAGVKHASVNLIFNPPPVKIDLIDDLRNNPEHDVFHYSIFNNPFFTEETRTAFLLKVAKRRGYQSIEEAYANDPGFRRDMYGEYAYDTNALIFDTNRIGTYSQLPESLSEYEKVMGVDIGGGAAKDAIVVICYNKYERKAWVDYEHELSSVNKDLEDLAAKIASTIKKYNMEYMPIMIDTGGLGKRVMHILRTKYFITGLREAKKADKMGHLLEMRTEAYRGRLLFKQDSMLMKEFPRIFYDQTHTGIDEDNSIHSDLLDACLYSMREVFNQYPEKKLKMTEREKRLQKKIEEHNRLVDPDPDYDTVVAI